MDERLLEMIELLIYNIGPQNFSVEEKLKFYELSNGYFFANDEDTMIYKSVCDMLAKEELERKSRTNEPTIKEEAYAIKEATGEPFPECLGSELQYCGNCKCVYSTVCFKRILEKNMVEDKDESKKNL